MAVWILQASKPSLSTGETVLWLAVAVLVRSVVDRMPMLVCRPTLLFKFKVRYLICCPFIVHSFLCE